MDIQTRIEAHNLYRSNRTKRFYLSVSINDYEDWETRQRWGRSSFFGGELDYLGTGNRMLCLNRINFIKSTEAETPG